MKKKKKLLNKEIYDIDNQESDDYFYYIGGYTSNGFPYGITWEEAIKDGLIESKELENDTEELPF
jgi:hypothetical protein